MRRLSFAALFYFAGCFAICFIGGCATSPANNLAGKNYVLKTFSLRNQTGLSESDCPVTSHGWRDDSLVHLVHAANACEQYKRTTRLEEIGNVLAQRFSNKPWGAFYLSLSAFDRQQYPRALWMIELALKKTPNVGLLTYQRARVFLAMGQLASAANAFRDAVNESPRLVDARFYLVHLYIQDRYYDKAQDQLEKIVEYDPADDTAWANLGEVYIYRHDSSDALAAYRHASNLNPENLQYRLQLAELYEKTKNDKAALSAYEAVQELAENNRVPANEINVDLPNKIMELKKITTTQTGDKK